MRKIILGFLLFLLVGTVSLFFNMEAVLGNEITKKTLYAGQSIPVGEIHVWNDSDTLYVKYWLNNSGWEMTSSHLYVGSFEKLPKNRSGNPVVGHFPYRKTHAPSVDEYTYKIAKSDINMQDFVIAAHAVVQQKSEVVITPTISWSRSSEDNVLSTPGYGGQWLYDDVIGDFTDMTAIVWDNGQYNSLRPIIPDLNYASWEYAYNDGGAYDGYSDLRLFRANFNIPANINIASASLGVVDYEDRIPINDNVYVYVNEELLFWGGTRANDIGMHSGLAGIQAIGYPSDAQLETGGWYIPGTFPNITDLQAGANVIEVFTEENEQWGGMGELMLTVYGTSDGKTETAWGDGTRIVARGNWGTYFNYSWQLTQELVDTILVPSNGNSVESNIVLEDGVTYVLKASGTYRFAPWGDEGIADAKYSLRTPEYIPDGFGYDKSSSQWVDGAHLSQAHYLQIWINNTPANWSGSYNDAHIYSKIVTGDGTKLSFYIMDDYYGDNSGFLTVKIYQNH